MPFASLPRIALLLVVTAAGCVRPPPRTVARLEPLTAAEQARNVESFDEVWAKVADTYFKPDRLGSGEGNVDWQAVRDELRPTVASARSQADARAAIEAMLARLGETHFGLVPAELYRESGTSTVAKGDVGVTLRLLGNTSVVFHVEPNSSAALAGVRPGWILSEVNGSRLEPRVAEVRRAAEKIGLAEVKSQHAAQDALAADLGTRLRATFRDERNRPRRVTLTAGESVGETARLGNLPAMILRTESRTLDGGIGYFALSIFLDPPRVMPLFDAFIRQHRDAPGIIIDLRGNPGGISGMANGMAGYFFDADGLKLGTMITRAGSVGFSINPRLPHYAGPVAVLVDELSMSTSEIFAGGLQDLGRARVFGTRTPGAALPSTVVRLSNDDRFQFAVADYVSTGGGRLEGVGVAPDEFVPLNRDALLAGRDPALEAALEWIRRVPTTVPASGPASAPATTRVDG